MPLYFEKVDDKYESELKEVLVSTPMVDCDVIHRMEPTAFMYGAHGTEPIIPLHCNPLPVQPS